jgi:ankyrin repeat protein
MSGWNPLLQAMVRNPFCESELLHLLAHLHEVTHLGSTALHFAALRRDPRFVMFLLQQDGVQIDTSNRYGETALHWAVKADREQVVSLLLASGAQPDSADSEGASPIDWASEEGHHHLLPLLQSTIRLLSQRDASM